MRDPSSSRRERTSEATLAVSGAGGRPEDRSLGAPRCSQSPMDRVGRARRERCSRGPTLCAGPDSDGPSEALRHVQRSRDRRHTGHSIRAGRSFIRRFCASAFALGDVYCSCDNVRCCEFPDQEWLGDVRALSLQRRQFWHDRKKTRQQCASRPEPRNYFCHLFGGTIVPRKSYIDARRRELHQMTGLRKNLLSSSNRAMLTVTTLGK